MCRERARCRSAIQARARLDATRPNCRKSLTLAPPRAHSAIYFLNRRLRIAPGERPGYGKSASRCYNGQPAAKSARTLFSQNSLRVARAGAVQRHDGRGSESAYYAFFPRKKDDRSLGLKIPPRFHASHSYNDVPRPRKSRLFCAGVHRAQGFHRSVGEPAEGSLTVNYSLRSSKGDRSRPHPALHKKGIFFSRVHSHLRAHPKYKKQLTSMDILVLATMKNAANRDT